MTKNKFYYAYILLDQLFGIELDEDKFEEIGLVAWNLIGNKTVRLYKYTADVNDSDNSVDLPCNALYIEAVTLCGEDYQKTSPLSSNNNYGSAIVENYIESRKSNKHPLYLSGEFVKYHQIGYKLFLNGNYNKVNILYKGVVLDEDGLPEISDKEALAIATYCAFTHNRRQGLILRDKSFLEIATYLENEWKQKCDAARVPDHISQNEMDKVLDARSSWNKKIFGKSFKPVV